MRDVQCKGPVSAVACGCSKPHVMTHHTKREMVVCVSAAADAA